VSPILVRPVREQFEHDRVIRVLQAKYKRKYEVAINPGTEQNASVGVGDLTMYPDLVLFSQERNRKIHGTIEVETTESINTLEAQAEWAPFSKLRTPFFLYVPANSIDTARRLCSEHGIDPAEIWTYHTALDQIRFTMVYRSPDAPKGTIAEHKPKPPAPVVIEPEPERPAPIAGKAAAAKVVAAKAPVAKAPVAKAPAGKEALPNGAVKAKSAAPAKPPVAAKPAKAAKPPVPAKAAKPAPPANAAKPVKPAKSAKPAKPAKLAKPANAASVAKAAKSKPAKTAKTKAKSRR
jgi:hypothetical protein